jgi:hypothetical protein
MNFYFRFIVFKYKIFFLGGSLVFFQSVAGSWGVNQSKFTQNQKQQAVAGNIAQDTFASQQGGNFFYQPKNQGQQIYPATKGFSGKGVGEYVALASGAVLDTARWTIDQDNKVYRNGSVVYSRADGRPVKVLVLFITKKGVFALDRDGSLLTLNTYKNGWKIARKFPEIDVAQVIMSDTVGKVECDILIKIRGLLRNVLGSAKASDKSLVTDLLLSSKDLMQEQSYIGAAVQRGVKFVGGVDKDTEKIYSREGISLQLPLGNEWKLVDKSIGLRGIPGGIQNISINARGRCWVVNTANQVLFKNSFSEDDRWESVEGVFSQVISNNKDHIWAVGANNQVFFRKNVSPIDPSGVEWKMIPGVELQSLSIGDTNQLWGVGVDGTLYSRNGITDANPRGMQWQKVSFSGKVKNVTVSNKGYVWILDSKEKIYARQGISFGNKHGGWTPLPGGNIKQILALDHFLWCVDNNDKIFVLTGITPQTPQGRAWSNPLQGKFSFIFASGIELKESFVEKEQYEYKKRIDKLRIKKWKRKIKNLKEKLNNIKNAKKKRKIQKKIKKFKRKIKRLKSQKKRGKKSNKKKLKKKLNKNKKRKNKLKKKLKELEKELEDAANPDEEKDVEQKIQKIKKKLKKVNKKIKNIKKKRETDKL